MKKRITAIVMAAMLLCGCNSKPESESSVSAPESSISTPESSVSAPESSISTPESSASTPESSASTPESSISTPESSASTPESSISAPESSANKPESVPSASASLQNYYDELQNCYKEYVSGTTANILTPEGAKAYVEARTLGLEKFEKLVPPEKYAALHSEMLNFADAEREWNKVMLDYANGIIDTDQMTSKSQQIYGSTTVKSEFTTKCLGIITALNKEPEVTASDYGKFLQILYELSP